MQSARKPLSAIIAIEADKLRGKHAEPDGDEPEPDGDEEDGEEMRPEHDDDGMKAACQDVLDAMAKRDVDEMNRSLTNWADMYFSHQGGGEKSGEGGY